MSFDNLCIFTARAGHGLVCIGKFLYTAGGYNSISIRNRCLVSAEKYSLETDQWTKITGLDSGIAHFGMLGNHSNDLRYEPCCEKTGLRGFRPGPTQTGL